MIYIKSKKIVPIIMAAGFLLCTAVRTYGIVVCTDMTTGAYYHDSALLCNILYYGIIALTFVGAVIAVRAAEKGDFGSVAETDIVDGRAAVFGFGMLIPAICAGYEALGEARALTPSSMLIFADYIFAGVWGILAFVVLYKKEFKPFMGFIIAVGGVYFTVRGINCFKERMVIASIPEYLAAPLCATGAALTMLSLGRFLSGNSGKLTKRTLFGWGTATAVAALSNAAATALADLTAPEEISRRITLSKNEAEMFFQTVRGNDGYMMAYTPLVDILSGAFIAAALIVILFAKHTENVENNVENTVKDELEDVENYVESDENPR
ncbi:MAG: hypothetical protein NC299_10185 [Lachnospiraceae bacterium]|nr:hypothetical protein [Ruminococcus sp.]MCM1275715.1 hypothetical protein [Lachnospiraceae bacterium]